MSLRNPHHPPPADDRHRRLARRKVKGVIQSAMRPKRPLTARRPVLRALLIFLALLTAFYTFEFTSLARGPARRAYLQ